eukprot:GHVN01002121.1.p1 GENE.GHVN01002121.1~~GHVN01002121.1.p1  ORF type:complete len:1087 (-),score=167.59 GHVN01002121.1:2764-6024(-)
MGRFSAPTRHIEESGCETPNEMTYERYRGAAGQQTPPPRWRDSPNIATEREIDTPASSGDYSFPKIPLSWAISHLMPSLVCRSRIKVGDLGMREVTFSIKQQIVRQRSPPTGWRSSTDASEVVVEALLSEGGGTFPATFSAVVMGHNVDNDPFLQIKRNHSGSAMALVSLHACAVFTVPRLLEGKESTSETAGTGTRWTPNQGDSSIEESGPQQINFHETVVAAKTLCSDIAPRFRFTVFKVEWQPHSSDRSIAVLIRLDRTVNATRRAVAESALSLIRVYDVFIDVEKPVHEICIPQYLAQENGKTETLTEAIDFCFVSNPVSVESLEPFSPRSYPSSYDEFNCGLVYGGNVCFESQQKDLREVKEGREGASTSPHASSVPFGYSSTVGHPDGGLFEWTQTLEPWELLGLVVITTSGQLLLYSPILPLHCSLPRQLYTELATALVGEARSNDENESRNDLIGWLSSVVKDSTVRKWQRDTVVIECPATSAYIPLPQLLNVQSIKMKSKTDKTGKITRVDQDSTDDLDLYCPCSACRSKEEENDDRDDYCGVIVICTEPLLVVCRGRNNGCVELMTSDDVLKPRIARRVEVPHEIQGVDVSGRWTLNASVDDFLLSAPTITTNSHDSMNPIEGSVAQTSDGSCFTVTVSRVPYMNFFSCHSVAELCKEDKNGLTRLAFPCVGWSTPMENGVICFPWLTELKLVSLGHTAHNGNSGDYARELSPTRVILLSSIKSEISHDNGCCITLSLGFSMGQRLSDRATNATATFTLCALRDMVKGDSTRRSASSRRRPPGDISSSLSRSSHNLQVGATVRNSIDEILKLAFPRLTSQMVKRRQQPSHAVSADTSLTPRCGTQSDTGIELLKLLHLNAKEPFHELSRSFQQKLPDGENEIFEHVQALLRLLETGSSSVQCFDGVDDFMTKRGVSTQSRLQKLDELLEVADTRCNTLRSMEAKLAEQHTQVLNRHSDLMSQFEGLRLKLGNELDWARLKRLRSSLWPSAVALSVVACLSLDSSLVIGLQKHLHNQLVMATKARLRPDKRWIELYNRVLDVLPQHITLEIKRHRVTLKADETVNKCLSIQKWSNLS